jgi:cytochrome c oxidase assembly factor CtaG
MLAAAASAPGVWDWSLNPPLVLILCLALMYYLGDRRTVTPERRRAAQRWRMVCFYGALAVLAVALCSPLDLLSDQLFWAHMIQHVLLIAVAAPMVVLSRPWLRLWRALPLASRRWLARGIAQGRRTAPLRGAGHFLGRPVPTFVLFSVVLVGWHVPAFFDATLRSETLHAFEHTLFLAASVLFFKQVIPSPPLRITLLAPGRVLYTIGAMIVMWALAVVLALEPHALYSFYADLPSRPGGISALADQQIAAGIMWVPGSVTFVIVVFAYVHRWLTPAPPPSGRTPQLAA